ncbi:dihydroneopterin aldolase [Chondrinema litorale]|uniref:dihydroneopterin aldolase n=1 Tax=Chondrinema litorale TaxID=2994555 RepID=UPI002544CB41|nr:dihydroneopterin aldolase [Chondrinema litorale]UZR94898.1 dihydroneopterin aldolase [Chondrinema litorale]
MGKIKLEGLEFFAYHGFYKTEREVGRKFGVDIEVTVDFSKAAIDDTLNDTINYEHVYNIVKEEMATPVKLLEFLADKICNNILLAFNNIEDVHISIKKFDPPIGGICRSATVEMLKKKDEIEK